MKKIISLLVLIACFATVKVNAQMFTASPSPLQESSQNVEITFHADQSGVAGLTNLPSTTAIYAHLGVCTTKSPNSWSHVVTTWGKADPAYQFEFVTLNTFKIHIGDLRTYFNVTDPNERITKVCVIARNAGGSVQTSDQFIDVVEEGFQLELVDDAPGSLIVAATNVKFTVNATKAAELKLYVNDQVVASQSSATTLTKTYSISTPGSYNVKATATADGQTLTKEAHFLYVSSSSAGTYPGGVPKMGAVKNNDGSVTFCLAAPGKSSVILMPSWDNYEALEKNVMKYQDYNGQRYFFTTVTGLDNTTAYPYYYVVDGTISVADPYAHLVLDCYNDKWLNKNVYPDRPTYPYDKFDNIMLAVYKGNLDDYDWKVTNFNIPSHENLNVYELLVRDFTGKNSTADGTIRGVIEKIPYLKDLGINALELMPIMEFNGNNSWGYNTNFYMAPDKAYGSPDDYKELIDKCHQEGIAVILDIVFNQSDGLHPWYMMYPIDSNPFYNKYAPHDYSVLNDWKQEHPLVQKQWEDAIRYWMTAYKVDGFRFDLVKGLGTSYPSGTESYNASRIAVTKRLHAAIKAVNPKGIHINEHLAGAQEENEMGADGQLNWSNLNYSACQYAMGYGDGANLNGFHAPNYGRTIGTTVAYAESHDEERMGYKQNTYGNGYIKGKVEPSMKRLGSVAAQMLMSPGSKMIWQFGELGADQTTKTSTGGNDTSPKKVVWNYLEDPDRHGLYDNYRDLLWLRLHNPELFANNASITYNDFSNSITGTRSIRLNASGKEIVAMFNPAISGSDRTCTVSTQSINASNYKVAASSYGFTPVVNASSGSVSCNIPPHCFVVITTNNVSGIDNVVAADTNNKVWAEDGMIKVIGDYNNVNIYNLAGRSFTADSRLESGIYIVNVDGKVTKIVVR